MNTNASKQKASFRNVSEYLYANLIYPLVAPHAKKDVDEAGHAVKTKE